MPRLHDVHSAILPCNFVVRFTFSHGKLGGEIYFHYKIGVGSRRRESEGKRQKEGKEEGGGGGGWYDHKARRNNLNDKTILGNTYWILSLINNKIAWPDSYACYVHHMEVHSGVLIEGGNESPEVLTESYCM